ncbi:MAG: hypothetical protein IJK51_02010 [Bacteroidaceae bacterium]|nr:hypothetical protein [Bacteroidaceae bacterium]
MYENIFINVSLIYKGHGEVFRSYTSLTGGAGRINGPEEWDGNCKVELQSDAGVITVKAKYPQIKWATPGDYLKCKLQITPMGEVFLNSAILDVERTVLNNFIIKSKDERI